jgi:hypothetical protein
MHGGRGVVHRPCMPTNSFRSAHWLRRFANNFPCGRLEKMTGCAHLFLASLAGLQVRKLRQTSEALGPISTAGEYIICHGTFPFPPGKRLGMCAAEAVRTDSDATFF